MKQSPVPIARKSALKVVAIQGYANTPAHQASLRYYVSTLAILTDHVATQTECPL